MEELICIDPEVLVSEEVPSFCSINTKNKVEVNDAGYIEFLSGAGFAIRRNADKIEFVRINNKIISKVTTTDIKQFVIEFVSFNEKVCNYFLRTKTFFSKDYLNALSIITPPFYRDTKDAAFFFYKNGVVKVTKDGITQPIPYDQTDYLVWKHHIIDREFEEVDINTTPPVFGKFIAKLANEDSNRLQRIWTIIGYALHNYRTSSNTKAIIFNDEVVNEQPEGGSGKSLLAKSLGQIRNLVLKDGKSFNPLENFSWSDVDETTDLVLIDETNDHFKFESLFSVITNGIPVERKNIDRYYLPIEKSPLLIITTNNIINGYSGSFKRRKYSVDIHQYFNHSHTPIDEYGHTFFMDWGDLEWRRFDNYMLLCVCEYLRRGVVSANEVDTKYKDAIRATNPDFASWFVENVNNMNEFTSTSDAINNYIAEFGNHNKNLSARKFRMFLSLCCNIYGYKLKDNRTSQERGFQISLN